MKTYVLDTHALVWYLTNDHRLGAGAEAILGDPEVALIIPAIVLAEIKDLAHKRRLGETLDHVLSVLEADNRCVIRPIDLAVIRAMPAQLDIHDALIVGVALAQATPVDGVLTCDRAIADSSLVQVIW